ncbi:unnamed protein product [Penicillium roqueforti FM164]|uniref:Genomic scaffold, ProqFM164S01 n=1 Tax=Penicillium roqueforti (strain FM164) TaxID=1365484 RepID=W6PXU8_PENRF|nr:unnamed protein product [Penicillium roqueforti FM164]
MGSAFWAETTHSSFPPSCSPSWLFQKPAVPPIWFKSMRKLISGDYNVSVLP